MPIIPRELITQARGYHPDFERDRHPNSVLLRRMRTSARKLVRKAVEIAPEPLGTTDTISAAEIATALADTDGRITVPAYITPVHCRAFYDPDLTGGDAESEVEMVYEAARFQGGSFFPSVLVLDTAIQLTDLRKLGNTEHGWEQVTSMEWVYVPDPELADPDDLDTSIDAALVGTPDSLEGALELDLAAFMARRSGVQDADFRMELKDETETWLYTLQQKMTALPWRVGPMPDARGGFPLGGLG